jgi:hypothetical protein
MAGEVNQALAGAYFLALVASGPAALAQGAGGWVDPSPADLKTPAASPAASSRPWTIPTPDAAWPDEASRRRATTTQVAQPSEKPAATETPVKPVTRSAEAPPDDEAEPARRATPTKAASKKKPPRERPVVAQRKKPASPVRAVASRPDRRRIAARPLNEEPVRAVRSAEYGQYEVMRLRTIEFPDGRRIEVLSRPDQAYVGFPFR